MFLDKEEYKTILPGDLYREIEDICKILQEIQREAAGILCHGKMPDSTAQLQDVLQSTEAATHTILDAAGAINEVAGASFLGQGEKETIGNHVMRIYEACTFQDITGQRIQKVLKNLNQLETRLLKLSEVAKAYGGAQCAEQKEESGSSLLNGPAPSGTTSQADVDRLFSSSQ